MKPSVPTAKRSNVSEPVPTTKSPTASNSVATVLVTIGIGPVPSATDIPVPA
jgi:hypothetical protein